MTKGKEVHIRTSEDLYKRYSKLAIDEDMPRGQFIEKAIIFYCDYLEEKFRPIPTTIVSIVNEQRNQRRESI